MRKHNRTLTILLLPVILCVFIAGWLLYCIGEPKGTYKTKTANDKITIGGEKIEQ